VARANFPQNLAHSHPGQVLDPFGATQEDDIRIGNGFSQTGGNLSQCN
jgi:hypothetical protein